MSKIKSVSLFKFDYVLKDIHSEEFELKGGIYNKTTYDEEGRTLSEIKYDDNGVVEQHYGYAYNEQGVKIADRSWDESGNLIDDMEYDLDADGKVLFAYKNYLDGSRDTVTYHYDGSGNLITKELRSDEDEVEQVDTYAYNGSNQVLHETRNEENELVYRKETSYNETDNVLEEKTWMAENDTTTRVVNQYDQAGELIGVSSLSENGDVIFKVNYERDGKLITSVTEETPGRTAITRLEYDENGNAVVQEERNKNGELNSRIERKFDQEGHVIESEAIIDAHGTGRNQHYLLKYEYEFYDD